MKTFFEPILNRTTTRLIAPLVCLSVFAAILPAQTSAQIPSPTVDSLTRIENLEPIARSNANMVASVHPQATAAGIQAFERGGNAIDAAIATALMLGVVDGANSGIGGGCFILVRTAEGAVIAIDGREQAPAAAHRDLYLRNGVIDPQLSQTGALAIGVPGALAAYHAAVTELGTLKFSQLLESAAEVADDGFIVTDAYAARLAREQSTLAQFPASASVLLRPDGSAYPAGDSLVQPDLAETYRNIAQHGPSWFYNGAFAIAVEEWCSKNDGILTARDFANYKTVRRTPIRTTYRGYEIIGFPPPSSGGVHVAEILNILESFDLQQIHQNDPVVMQHVIAEAMKLAFADRAYWLGDPDHINVPRGLIDREYANKLASRIDLQQTSVVLSHGIPPKAEDDFFEKHTTHIAAADAAGNWVAITTTVNTTFGSKVIIPGTGVIMNNQMDDFSIAPGVPNAFGLIGGENNAVAAGKRPLSSMSPTIVMRDGQPILTLGAAGGPTIITQVVNTLVNRLDLGMPIDQAIAAPRLHHQWSPDVLMVEDSMDAIIKKGLAKRGHTIESSGGIGVSQAIAFDPATGMFSGVADPRTTGAAGSSKTR